MPVASRMLVLFLVGISACGSESRPSRTRPGFGDATKPITIAVGQEFELVLSSNPTTDYHWWLVELTDPAVCKHVARDYVPDPNPDRMTGVGGTDYWVFQGLKAGQSKVTMRYSRDEKEGKAATVTTFTIVVR